MCERHLEKFPRLQSIHKFCGAGPAVAWKQSFSFPSDNLHTVPESFLPPLLPSLFFFSTALNMARWLESSLYGPWGGEIHQKSLSLTDTTKCTLSPLVQQSGNDPLTLNGLFLFMKLGHIHTSSAMNKQNKTKKKLSPKNELMKKAKLISAFHAA